MDAQIRIIGELRVAFFALRVMAPPAIEGTALHKKCGTDARAVMNSKMLAGEYFPLHAFSPSIYVLLQGGSPLDKIILERLSHPNKILIPAAHTHL